MDIEKIIKESKWWKTAQSYPDRHFPVDANTSLAAHILAVYNGIDKLFDLNSNEKFIQEINAFFIEYNLNRAKIIEVLKITILLHDIGKPYDDKWHIVDSEIVHKVKKVKHEYLGEKIALLLLPDQYEYKKLISKLVRKHDKPYRWYKKSQYLNFIPNYNDWRKLDCSIIDNNSGLGIIYLILIKLIDTHGHFHLNDVFWFIQNANNTYLSTLKIKFPIPNEKDLRKLVDSGFL